MRSRYLIFLANFLLLPAAEAVAAGTINVNLNIGNATFTISGPASYSGGGFVYSQNSAPAGSYTITYASSPGFATPQPETQVLSDGGSITFNGNYTQPALTGQIYVITDLPAATFTLSGAGNYAGSGSFWLQTNAPAGTYTVSFAPVAGFPTPHSQTGVLAPGGTLTLTGSYGVAPGNTGSINVSTDLPGASFTITGTNTYMGSGTFWAQTNVPTGAYNIVYNPVPGYPTPPSQTLVLGPGGTITFTARYGPTATTGTITVTTNLTAATFAISGPQTFNGSGTGWSQSNCPPGVYTVTFGLVPGYPTPPSQTLTLYSGGLIAFTGTYGSSLNSGVINVTTNLPAGSFLITGPTSYGGNGSSFAQGNAPAGTYTITYGSVTGFTTPASQTQVLTAGGSITFIGNYVPVTSANGSIFVVTDRSEASFNITGPTNYSGSGKLWVQSNVPPGIYSITYNPVSGYATPEGQIFSLSASGTITFSSNYGPPASTGTIIVSTNLTAANFVISGANYYQGTGGIWTKPNALTGVYTITFLSVPGYPTPPGQTLTLAAGGAITFNGNYGAGASSGTINVTTNMPNASFTLSGPVNYSGSGLSWSQTGVPAGTYIMTYSSIPGYTAPPSEARSLVEGGALNFSGIYTLTSPLDLPVAPNSLNFTYDLGQALPSAQKLQITTPQAVLLTASVSSGSGWLSVTPSNSATPASLTVSVNPAGLSGGIYSGSITISAGPSYHVLNIPITLNVRDAAKLILTPSTMSFAYELSGKMPSSQDLFVAASGRNVSYKISSSASWLSVSGTSLTPAKLSVAVNPGNLAPGTYTASILATSEEAINSPQTAQVMLVVTGVSSQLGISAVSNAAYGDTRLAPCSMASVYGAHMGQAVDTASVAPLPFLLSGARVKINGEPAAIYYASPVQINFQVPCDLSPGTAQLEVNNGLASTFSPVEIRATAPGVFLSGGKWAAAINEDGSVLDGSHPANPGRLLTVYFTGQGLLDSQIATGDAAPANRLLRPQATADVKIGKSAAEILFIGLTPGSVGIAQVNLRVPALLDGEYPLVLTVGGAAGNPASVSIKNQ